ncbi:MAG: hypothetical protein M3P98_04515 [bacterium]|nr:hypothetical protein [bacterium]
MTSPRATAFWSVMAGILALLYTLTQGDHLLTALFTSISVGILISGFLVLINLVTAIVLKRQSKPLATVDTNWSDRYVFVKSQLTRVHIMIRAKHYTLTGTPADRPQEGDEVVPTQLQLLKIYEQYGIYKTNFIDEFMGQIESLIGTALSSRATRTSWTRDGDIN